MEIEELRQLADSFFEWPTEDRTQVTLTSALRNAQHVLRITQQQAEPVAWLVVGGLSGKKHVFANLQNAEISAQRDEGALIMPLYTAPTAQPDPWAPSVVDYDKNIHSNADALEWADLFVKTFPGLADKHELMIGWFANAMMAMHDHLLSQQQAQPAPIPTSERDEFMRGAMIAISCLVRCHGPSQYAEDIVIQLGFSGFDLSNLGLEEFDLEPLRELNEYNALGLTMPPAPGGSDE